MTETSPRASRRRLGRRARLRLAGFALALLVFGYSLATGGVPGVGAIFTADVENQGAAAAGGWIPAPSGLSIDVGGSANDQAALTWTSGASAASPSPNPVTGQTLMYADGGSGASASCGSYSPADTVGAATTTDSVGETPAADWWCFQMVSDSAGSWTSSAVDFPPIQLLVPISVTIANGGTAGKIDNGDTITITYNQNIKASGTTIAAHACKTQSIVIIGAGCTGTGSVGEIDGFSIPANANFTASPFSISGATFTLTLANASATPTISGGGPFIGSGNKVKAVAGNTLVCGGSNCQPSSSGSF